MYKKYILIKLLLLLFSTPLLAWINITDDSGRQIRLEQPAKRIVSLAPHITENLFRIGAGRTLVAVVEYSDYPLVATQIERVGSFNKVDLERVAELKPDLVVAWGEGTPAHQLSRLEQLGIKVLRESPRSFNDIAASLTRLGSATGFELNARRQVSQMEQRLGVLRRRYRDASPVKLFYQLWQQPLITLNRQQLIHQMIELCGAVNPFADRIEMAPRIGLEGVVEANPDLIVAGLQKRKRRIGIDENWRNYWAPWHQITAVREDLLFSIPADLTHRPTMRALDGVEQMCKMVDQARSTLAVRH
ncbi:cobalamin-binding protein [Marinobacterium jannaschii]|uniref:cobalamin-binding protein n=1 Tax=Marinobacterium jannaschii TaxID=64970 RepID=UPI000569F048|nr:cobalamin-binding protein [Marinobacterium jannaschii]